MHRQVAQVRVHDESEHQTEGAHHQAAHQKLAAADTSEKRDGAQVGELQFRFALGQQRGTCEGQQNQ